MLKRPINPRFEAAVLEDRKITTIRKRKIEDGQVASSPLFRVFWRGMEVGVDTNCWASNPDHVDDHLFINRTGRVFWLSHAGMSEITQECRLELANKES